jgi:hypothetical protein
MQGEGSKAQRAGGRDQDTGGRSSTHRSSTHSASNKQQVTCSKQHAENCRQHTTCSIHTRSRTQGKGSSMGQQSTRTQHARGPAIGMQPAARSVQHAARSKAAGSIIASTQQSCGQASSRRCPAEPDSRTSLVVDAGEGMRKVVIIKQEAQLGTAC